MPIPAVPHDAANEADLLARSRRYDLEAFLLLVERYAEPVFNVIAHMVPKQDEVKRLARDTFLAAYGALSAWPSDAIFSSCVSRVALQGCRDWLGANQPEPLGDEEAQTSETEPHPTELSAERLYQAMYALPVLYREAFVLRHVEGLQYEEIGSIVNARAETVRMRVYQARARLTQRLIRVRGQG